MSLYSFKKQTKIYIVYNGLQYNIEVSDISFSQTFTEISHAVKTLHTPNQLFEASVINKANPANFEFSLPLVQESDHDILFDLLFSYDTTTTNNLKSFDLYIATQLELYKIEGCFFTNGSFNISRNSVLGMSLSGEGIKLTRTTNLTVPGTPQSTTASPTYIPVNILDITLDNTLMSTSVYSLSIEFQNDVSWPNYTTLNSALLTVDNSTSMYPSISVLKGRILSGSIGRYIREDNGADIQQWSVGVPLKITAKEIGGSGIDIDTTEVSVTNRTSVNDVFTQHYDWRMTQNPSDLTTIITKM